MMIRNRIFLKSVAVFLALEMLITIISPAVSWALTSGPTAPEYTSFEPVDTSDMVNLATGDFVYNIPLLEVPGPAGGYPVTLSYHAGIKPNQEASWVGLGWTLNVGAINRTVNGYADDDYNSRRELRNYWDGGETTTKTYSIGINIPNYGIGVSFTLALSHDTYKGFSRNGYPGLMLSSSSIKQNSSTIEAALNNFKTGRTFSVGIQKDNVTLGYQESRSQQNIGISLGSQGVKAVGSVVGKSMQNNQRVSSIYTNSVTKNGGEFQFAYGSFGLKQYYTRYWSDQADALYTYGSLHAGKSNSKQDEWIGNASDPDYLGEVHMHANDIYDIYEPLDPNEANWDLDDEADPSKLIGGTLPAVDRYDVLAQGLGGIIEPFIFQNGYMRGQNYYERDKNYGSAIIDYPTLKYKSMEDFKPSTKVDFRFKNEFSNSLTINAPQISEQFTKESNVITANDDGFKFDLTSQKLAGSKDVQWFTNYWIGETSEARLNGFIDCYSDQSDRPMEMDIYDNYLQPEACIPSDIRNYRGKGSGLIETDTYEASEFYANVIPKFQSLKPRSISLEQKIGGFKITNESGVTYHYALPVYAYNEYTRIKAVKPLKNAATITETKSEEPYAYTWLLTAITGPDFVDRGGINKTGNGILDDADWGYWVKFEYGRWADAYQWRTPHDGYMSEIESDYSSFSYGVKELYYLDAIETKTHKALFVKSKRKDGYGVTSRLEGGSNPRRYKMTYRWDNGNGNANLNFSVSPVATLKLDAIYLYEKKDLKDIIVDKATGNQDEPNGHIYYYTGDNYDGAPVFPTTLKDHEDFIQTKYHNWNLVLDEADIKDNPDFINKAQKVIRLNTDYSLSKGVPNSFGFYTDFANPTPVSECNLNLQVTCLDKEYEYDFIWPQAAAGCAAPRVNCCDYLQNTSELNNAHTLDKNAFYSSDPLSRYFLSGPCTDKGKDFGGKNVDYFRTGKLTLNSLEILGKSGLAILPKTLFSYAANEPYIKASAGTFYDEWGYFKNDYKDFNPFDNPESQVLNSRRITDASAKYVHAWSLNSIKTPLGAEISIKYEANDYSKSIYLPKQILGIEKMERPSFSNVRIFFNEKNLNLNNFFEIGKTVELRVFLASKYLSGPLGPPLRPHPDFYTTSSDYVLAIDDEYIDVKAPQLHALLGNRTAMIDGVSRSLTPYFVSGAIAVNDLAPKKYAGGIRVKELTVKSFADDLKTVEYSYNIPNTTISSGVTSFVPFNLIGVSYPTENEFFQTQLREGSKSDKRAMRKWQTKFQKQINLLYEDFLVYGRQGPSPGAVYEFVTIKSKVNGVEADSYMVHQFEVLDPDMVQYNRSDYGIPSAQRSTVVLKNNAVNVGNLKRVMTYSKDQDLLEQINYGYLNDEVTEPFELSLKSIKQGVVEQAFHKYIEVKKYENNGWIDFLDEYDIETLYSATKAVVTKKQDYSNVLTSLEKINYRTGIQSRTEYHAFDFFSGKALKTLTEDGYGNRYLTESLPAYRVIDNGNSVYPTFGIKLKNKDNKNMLTQEAGTFVYKVDEQNNKVGLVEASIQTWSNQIPVIKPDENFAPESKQPDIWRKYASYVFIGDDEIPLLSDGLYPVNSITPFNRWHYTPDEVSDPIGWQKLNFVELYDVYSHDLQERGIDNIPSATRMSFDQSRVLASVGNAEYFEFAYSGAEEIPDNNFFSEHVQHGTQPTDFTTEAHSGKQAIVASPGNRGFTSHIKPKQRTYRVSLWSSEPSCEIKYQLDGSSTTESASIKLLGKAGDWNLIEADIQVTGPHVSLEIWCEAEVEGVITKFDDFRVSPVDAPMTSYVYDEWGRLTHILDQNNMYTEYRYDVADRLIAMHKETFKYATVKISENIYHYGNHE